MATAITPDANLGSAVAAGSSSSIAVTTTAAAAAGTRIVVAVSWFNSPSRNLNSVSGGGLTWVVDREFDDAGGKTVAIASADAPSGLASSTTITATLSGTATERAIAGGSFFGIVGGASGYVGTGADNTTGAVSGWNSGNVSPSAYALLFTVAQCDHLSGDRTNTPTAPAVELFDLSPSVFDDVAVEYRVVWAGTYTVAGAWNSAPDETTITTVAYLGADPPPRALEFDAEVESVRTGTTDPMTWTHTPAGTPKGIVVAFTHGVSSTDHVLSVTYGGVAMTRIVRATDTVTEPGASELWFLGSGIPTGAQTVSADLASATTDDIQGVSWSVAAEGDTEVIDSDSISENAADPTVTLTKGGREGWCVAAMYGGGAAPGGTLAAGNTLGPTEDLGAFYAQTCRETTIDTSDHTIGWSTLGTDDLAFVALCVAQAQAATALVQKRPGVVQFVPLHFPNRW